MFVLKCRISGYMLQSLEVGKGVKCGIRYKTMFTLLESNALTFEDVSHANVWRDLVNAHNSAPLPYDFGEHTRTIFETVKVDS